MGYHPPIPKGTESLPLSLSLPLGPYFSRARTLSISSICRVDNSFIYSAIYKKKGLSPVFSFFLFPLLLCPSWKQQTKERRGKRRWDTASSVCGMALGPSVNFSHQFPLPLRSVYSASSHGISRWKKRRPERTNDQFLFLLFVACVEIQLVKWQKSFYTAFTICFSKIAKLWIFHSSIVPFFTRPCLFTSGSPLVVLKGLFCVV